MVVGVYVVAVYENCSTGIGFADEASVWKETFLILGKNTKKWMYRYDEYIWMYTVSNWVFEFSELCKLRKNWLICTLKMSLLP